MGYEHDLMAHAAAKVLLSQLREGTSDWSTERLTTGTTYWQGMAGWPRPDYAFEDRSTQASLAIEFKPPAQSKREYVTAIGQSITYLNTFEYAAIILPTESTDGFKIAQYVADSIDQNWQLPLAVFTYAKDPGSSTDLHNLLALNERENYSGAIPGNVGRKVFWAYWRDLSQHEVLQLLALMDKDELTFDAAFEHYWQERLQGQALTWEGEPRNTGTDSSARRRAEAANTSISLKHIGLVESNGKLTEAGYELLHLGKIYGADSKIFLQRLGKRVLEDGKHIDLILWVQEQQRLIGASNLANAGTFYHGLDTQLAVQGVIIEAPSESAKENFLRDEKKLWNKLGLLREYAVGRYFHPGEGLAFNWDVIISMLK